MSEDMDRVGGTDRKPEGSSPPSEESTPRSPSDSRLRALVEENRSILESLDTEVVLRRTIHAAVTFFDTRDGAVALFDESGRTERLLSWDDPSGASVLSSLNGADLTPLTRVEKDPRRAGVSIDGLDDFLSVPLRSHGETYGALYLVGRAGRPFTSEDEDLLMALAGTAGVALENARLHEELRRRLVWSSALTQVSSALLSEDVTDVVGVVVARVATVVATDTIGVVIPDPDSDQLLIHTARGTDAERFEGRRYERPGSLVDRALRSGQVVLAPAGDAAKSLEAEMGPNMVLPVVVAGEAICALTFTRSRGGDAFTAADVDMAAEFATHTGVAIELTRARVDRQRLELADERARIARDLHDHVIQRLFAAGLSLQAIAARFPAAESALSDQVDAIDSAIGEIRTAVFALTSRTAATTGTIRHRVLDIVSEMSESLRLSPQLTFRGPVDLMLTGDLADDVLAVVRECLANAARHAAADEVAVSITIDSGCVEVAVTDDGLGIAPDSLRRSGTDNLARRARHRGGEFVLSAQEGGGTRALWRALLSEDGVRV